MRNVIERCLLKDLLKKRDITQAEFARRMGIPRQTVTKWLKLEDIMRADSAYRASLVLNCSMEDLYEWIKESEEKVADK